jgi:colanic acid/amylovoran biosynthesis glycosyltransferase
MGKPSIFIFTEGLLLISEKFIDQHARSLTRYSPVLAGVKKVAGIETDPTYTEIIRLSRWERFMFYVFGHCPALDRILKERGVTLLHAHFHDSALLLANYARRHKMPLVVTLHGADVVKDQRRSSFRRRAIRAVLQRALFQATTLFLPVSDYLKKECEQRGYPPEKLLQHYLGIPPTETVQKPLDPDNRNVVFVGRLVEKKGPAYFVEAIAQLHEAGTRVQGIMVGDGPLRRNLEKMAISRGLPIEFRGALPHTRALEIISSAAIFCMPSTQAPDGDNEGLGLVYLEAQAAGVPVVAFNQGPIPEAVIDGITGLLVPDKDAGKLAMALGHLLSHPQIGQEMGRQGQQFVRRQFDINAQAARLEMIYDRVSSPERVSTEVLSQLGKQPAVLQAASLEPGIALRAQDLR